MRLRSRGGRLGLAPRPCGRIGRDRGCGQGIRPGLVVVVGLAGIGDGLLGGRLQRPGIRQLRRRFRLLHLGLVHLYGVRVHDG